MKVSPFLADAVYSYLYKEGHFVKKALAVLGGFSRRFRMLFSVASFDYVFIFREATPLGPPIVEFLLSAMGKKLIYDFDVSLIYSMRTFFFAGDLSLKPFSNNYYFGQKRYSLPQK